MASLGSSVGRAGGTLARAIGPTRGGIAQLPLPPAGMVRLRAVKNAALGLVAELGVLDDDDTDIRPTGYSEVQVTDRLARVALSQRAGQQPITMAIPLLLDRWSEQGSVEAECRILERLAGMDRTVPAPALIIEGVGIPNSFQRDPSLRWLNDGDLEWGTIAKVNGDRSLVEVTITLTELNAPTVVGSEDADDVDPRQRYVFTVPAGDELRTLTTIARAHGVSWQSVRALNPRLPSDPDKKLPAGRQVRIH